MDDEDYAILAFEWDDMSSEDKLAAAEEIINDYLAELNYPPVDVVGEDLDGSVGQYDGETGEVALDLDTTLGTDSFSEALDTIFHELGHALNDLTDEALFGDEDSDDFNAIDPETEELVDEGHREVEDFAAAEVDRVRAAVGAAAPAITPPPAGAAESSDGGGLGGEDTLYEPDFGAATVEGDGFSFEMGQPTVVDAP